MPSSIQVNALMNCKACGSRRNGEGEREGFMNVILTYSLTVLNSSIVSGQVFAKAINTAKCFLKSFGNTIAFFPPSSN